MQINHIVLFLTGHLVAFYKSDRADLPHQPPQSLRDFWHSWVLCLQTDLRRHITRWACHPSVMRTCCVCLYIMYTAVTPCVWRPGAIRVAVWCGDARTFRLVHMNYAQIMDQAIVSGFRHREMSMVHVQYACNLVSPHIFLCVINGRPGTLTLYTEWNHKDYTLHACAWWTIVVITSEVIFIFVYWAKDKHI